MKTQELVDEANIMLLKYVSINAVRLNGLKILAYSCEETAKGKSVIQFLVGSTSRILSGLNRDYTTCFYLLEKTQFNNKWKFNKMSNDLRKNLHTILWILEEHSTPDFTVVSDIYFRLVDQITRNDDW